MSTLLSSEDILLEFTNVAGPPGLTYGSDLDLDSDGVFGTHSQYMTCDTKKLALGSLIGFPLHIGKLNFLFTPLIPCPFSSVTYDFIGGNGFMIPALFFKSEGVSCYLDGAIGTCVGVIALGGGWKLKVNPFTPIPCSCTVELTDQDPPTNVKGT